MIAFTGVHRTLECALSAQKNLTGSE